jgi:hypothetical protein
MVTVYVVAYASAARGVSVAVVPEYVSVPSTTGVIWNAPSTTDAVDIASENVTLIVAVIGTLVARSAGLVETMVGAVVSLVSLSG